MKVAAIFVCAITAVYGSILDIDVDIELNSLGCPIDSTIQKFYPHTYCNMFYQCSNGYLIAVHCSGNLLFNLETLECDWYYNVDCGGRNVSDTKPEQTTPAASEENDGTCNDDPTEAPEICAQEDSEGVLIAHQYCNQFYKCSNEVPISLRCPKNLVFNPCRGICDWSENVDCGNRTISEDDDDNVGDITTEEAPEPVDNNHVDANEICEQEESDGKLVAHEYCNWFYICYDNQPVPKVCPKNLVFNPESGLCDWTSRVNCGNKTINEPEDDGNDTAETTQEPEPVDNVPVDANEICAQEDSDGTLAAHDYCNWFYICYDNQPVPQVCPVNLLFNPVNGECDWATRVNCGNKTIYQPEDDNNDTAETTQEPEPVDNVPVDANEICAQEESDGKLAAHEYCNWFYICYDNQPVPKVCPKNLVFNPESGLCDWTSRVNCGNKTINEPEDDGNDTAETTQEPEPVDNVPVDANEICAQEESDGKLAAHDYCNWFYICFDNQPVPQVCPVNLLFNPVIGECDWATRVNCGNKTIYQPEDDNNDTGETTEQPEPVDNVSVDANEICAQEESDGKLVAHEYCNWYYNCFDKRPVARKCPSGLVFNPVSEKCDWSSNVNCGNKTISDEEEEVQTTTDITTTVNDGPFNDNPDNASSICSQPDSAGVLIAHKNCNQFYMCSLLGPVALWCSNGLLYNYRTEKCDWPDSVDCGDRVIPDESVTTTEVATEAPNSDPSEAPEICARAGSDGVLIAHTNCNQYYKCYNGKPNALRCSSNLLYDIVNGWCDWPSKVDCGDRVVPGNDDSDDDSDVTAVCARASNEGALVAHANCNQFYKCSHGEAFELSCQVGLMYNTLLATCDWAVNVDCGDRLIL